MTWKYIPEHVGVVDRNTKAFHAKAKVKGVRLHPPVKERVHPGTAIRGDWYLAEVFTDKGRRTYGFVDGCIDSTLRMAVKLGPGQERDEVIAKWKDAPPNACPRPTALGSAKRRRRR